MKNLIYYPNFETHNTDWLKFALLYLDNFSPIVPESGEKTLTELYKTLASETDLLNIHRPTYSEGNRATKKAKEFILQVLKDPHDYAEELNSANATRLWKDPKNHTYTLFHEKYVEGWETFCFKHGLATPSDHGLFISQNLGEIYMTFLAQEVSYENEASPITDRKELDELSIYLRSKNVTEDNKLLVAKNIIIKQLPLNFDNLEMKAVIKLRNKPGFKELQQAFHNELDIVYENLGNAIDPSSFIKSYDLTMKEWSSELTSYGVQLLTRGISAYILINNQAAMSPEYLAEILESGLVLVAGKSIVKNINKDTDRRFCRHYLSELKNLPTPL